MHVTVNITEGFGNFIGISTPPYPHPSTYCIQIKINIILQCVKILCALSSPDSKVVAIPEDVAVTSVFSHLNLQ